MAQKDGKMFSDNLNTHQVLTAQTKIYAEIGKHRLRTLVYKRFISKLEARRQSSKVQKWKQQYKNFFYKIIAA